MKPLMIHVERAVRPVRAEHTTKCNMREELYAHLISIYDQEREQSADEETAITSACRRFGRPSELTAELQQTVPRLERVLVPLDQWTRRRKQETIVRHTWRIVVASLLFYTILSVVTISACHLLANAGLGLNPARGSQLSVLIRVVLALGCWFVVNCAVFTLLGYAMRHQLEIGIFRPRSWLIAGGLCVMAAVTAFGSGLGFLLLMPIDPDLITTLLPRWLLMAGMTPLGFAAASRIAAIENVRSRPWDSLVIDE